MPVMIPAIINPITPYSFKPIKQDKTLMSELTNEF